MPGLKKTLEEAPRASWAGFQVYYPMQTMGKCRVVRGSIDAVRPGMGVFRGRGPQKVEAAKVQGEVRGRLGSAGDERALKPGMTLYAGDELTTSEEANADE